MDEEEERNERVAQFMDFVCQERLKDIDGYDKFPQLLKDALSTSGDLPLVHELKALTIVDKEKWLKIVEDGIDQIGIGPAKNIINV